jgi:hypothetical protein
MNLSFGCLFSPPFFPFFDFVEWTKRHRVDDTFPRGDHSRRLGWFMSGNVGVIDVYDVSSAFPFISNCNYCRKAYLKFSEDFYLLGDCLLLLFGLSFKDRVPLVLIDF